MSGGAEEWDAAAVAWLRRLWAAGLSTAAIGREMTRSKNSVVGKAHRLFLPPRPSPIQNAGAPRPPAPRRVTGPTLAPLASVVAPVAVARVRPPAPAPVPVVVRASQPCCWPIGEPRTPDFRFCEDPGVPGRSYCAAHEALAWDRRPRDMSAAQREAAVERRMRAYERAAAGTGGHGLGFIISGGGL
jgi:GcrA cell cycle regulator